MKTISKIFFIALFICIMIPDLYSQDYWIQQPSPTTKYLRSIFFTDSLKGWIGGDSGLIIHTTDKGSTWTTQYTGMQLEIHSIFFVNERKGYALSWEFDATPPNYYGTRILSTTNGGLNWSNYLYPDTNLFLNSIYFLDSLKGFTAGSEGKIYYTTDSGLNWTLSAVDSSQFFSFPVESIKFVNSVTGYATGGAFDIAGMIWKTTNGGFNWRSVIVGPEPVMDLHIFDEMKILCIGGDFEYGPSRTFTTNAGVNWTYIEFGILGIANSIAFRTSNEGWVSLGSVDSLLLTTDGGSSWSLEPAPDGSQIFDIEFTDRRNGWAVGNNGAILKYNSKLININSNNSNIPQSVILFQNYPNPFNPSTKINYELRIKNYEFVSLKIFDALGREVAVLINQKQNAGRYEIGFDGSDFPSGIYYYTLTADGNVIDTKRMVLIK